MQLGFDPDKITFFAKTNARGQSVPFGIKAKDRQRHMYVIGKTGMGKSTLLENMAAQDIQSGEGMAFIDPHGSAIEALLEYVPEHRLDDVVYFAPFDMDNPISFNIMEDVGMDTRHLVVSGLMSTFKKIWEDAWSARMEYILTNALLALIEYPDTTLLSVNRMLADKAYRDKVIDHVKDPAVKAYWVDEFNNYTERFAAEALPAIQNKIGQFTGNPLIRNIIGQPHSSFDVRKMMDEKKILLVNLSKGLVGETNADLLGSMLITKIYLAAMSRAELPPAQMKQMPNFYFYVDEFQSFANSTFANILSEARKYHLNLIIAHQYVEQMEEKVRDAVFGNVGTTVTFRVGPFDAETLEPIFEPQFLANDLVNLGFAQIYLSLMIDGVGSPPFSAQTLPPVQTPPESHKYMVIKRSQANYCQPREQVEQVVNNLHTPDDRVEASEAGEGANHGGFTKPSAFFKVGKDKEFVKQKERLKDGGSRLKGPAQTPPGTNSGGGGGSSDKKPTRTSSPADKRPQSQARDKKPAPAQKTPEDLKAIIAGMVSTDGKKPETKTDDRNKSQNKDKAPTEKKPEVGSNDHRSDLKAALSGLSAQPDKSAAKETESKTGAEKPPAPTSAPQPNSTPPKERTDRDARQRDRERKNDRNKNQRRDDKKPRNENRQVNYNKPESKPRDLKGSLDSLVNNGQKINDSQNRDQRSASAPEKRRERLSGREREEPRPAQPENAQPKNEPKKHIANEVIRPKDNGQSFRENKDHLVKNFSAQPKQAPVLVAQHHQTEPAQQSQIRGVVVERRPQIPIATRQSHQFTPQAVSAPKAPEPNSGRREIPSFTPTSVRTDPTVKDVKKMLRHDGKEKLPGMM